MALNSLYGPAGISTQKNAIAGKDLVSIGRKTGPQMDLANQLFQGIQPGIQGGIGKLSRLASGDQSEFEEMERPAYAALQRGGSQLASQFSGAGMGARNSSGFQNSIAGQAGQLAETLQGKRQGLQQQALSELLGIGRGLLSEDLFDTQLAERKKSPWSSIIGGSLPFVGAAAGAGLGALGGPGGALAGAKIGGAAGSAASNAWFKD